MLQGQVLYFQIQPTSFFAPPKTYQPGPEQAGSTCPLIGMIRVKPILFFLMKLVSEKNLILRQRRCKSDHRIRSTPSPIASDTWRELENVILGDISLIFACYQHHHHHNNNKTSKTNNKNGKNNNQKKTTKTTTKTTTTTTETATKMNTITKTTTTTSTEKAKK